MKVAYIGSSDGLAEALIERMGQEGNDVYLLSNKELARKPKGISLHRFYRRPRGPEGFEGLLRSLAPDCVIFAGNHYISGAREGEPEEDVALLACSLRAAAAFPRVRFILLSSTEVYGNAKGKAKESAERAAASERGIRFIREEQLVELYRKQRGMDTAILRASQIYTSQPGEDGGDFLSQSFSAAVQGAGRMPAEVFQPLHASDLADAVKRAADGGRQPVYNVCGSAEVPAKRLYELVCRQEGLSGRDVRWEAPACTTLADSSRIRKELGWSDLRDLEELLEGGKLPYKRIPAEGRKKKKGVIPAGVRQLVKNLFLFALFFAINCLCASHSLFSHINWMMVYVILVSISYNLYQSTLAAVLASAAFLYSQGLDLLALNTFYSYADSVLVVMEFVFLGLMVSYTANMLREDARSARLDLEMLKEEYADLTAVNEENVLIKNEYEERLLTSKTGFPKLYSLISRLMVQEPDRILLETMSLLLRDSMEKALQYEELSREEHYVEGTDILKPEAFRKRVLLAREKAEKCMAEYCVAELVYSGPMADAATAAGRTLRVTDCLGTDGKGKLFALLNNTGPGNLEGLQKHLRDCA